ncbi:MAG: hypothetical protein LBJ31_08155 [Treponema sp.]|jgi:hypothetical protein|nr:hypothetical protein [Treponema sp.]
MKDLTDEEASALDDDAIDVEQVVNEVVSAEEQGKLRPAAKRESMAVRLAALSSIVHEMQKTVENDRELANV